jgi:hypothetical protein
MEWFLIMIAPGLVLAGAVIVVIWWVGRIPYENE